MLKFDLKKEKCLKIIFYLQNNFKIEVNLPCYVAISYVVHHSQKLQGQQFIFCTVLQLLIKIISVCGVSEDREPQHRKTLF